MLAGKKVLVVMPAYNAAQTLERTFKDIPFDVVDEVLLRHECVKHLAPFHGGHLAQVVPAVEGQHLWQPFDAPGYGQGP